MRFETMRFDAVLLDNGGTLTHRTSPVAAVRALAARLGASIPEEQAAHYWRRSKEHSRSLMAEKRRRRNLSRADHRAAYVTGYALRPCSSRCPRRACPSASSATPGGASTPGARPHPSAPA